MDLSKQAIIADLIEFKEVLVRFFKNPVGEIGNVPNWKWPKLLAFLALYSAFCGFLTGVVQKKIGLMFLYFFVGPLTSFAMIGISTLFFAIFFKIFANRDLPWRHLFTVIVFANLPHILLMVADAYIPAILAIGLIFSSMLLIKGFVEIFKLDKTLVIRVVAGLYLVFFLSWAINELSNSERDRKHLSDDDRAPEVMLSK